MTKLVYFLFIGCMTFGHAATGASRTSYDFGPIRIDRLIKRAKRWTINNNSDKPLYIEGLNMTGEGYSIKSYCQAEIRPHYFCEFWIFFVPTEEKAYPGQLQLSYASGESYFIDTLGSGYR